MTAEQRQPVEDPPRLVASGWYHLRDRGWVATFAAGTHGLYDPRAYIGHPVVIDDVEYRVIGVEMFARLPVDDRLGEAIGLLVAPATDRAVDGADTEETP